MNSGGDSTFAQTTQWLVEKAEVLSTMSVRQFGRTCSPLAVFEFRSARLGCSGQERTRQQLENWLQDQDSKEQS